MTGIIDIDADSITLSIYEQDNDKTVKVLSISSASGLIGYVVSATLTTKGIQNVCFALEEYLDILSKLEIKNTYIYVSFYIREMTNSQELISRIKERSGVRADILSGEEVAELGYYGAGQSISIPSGLFVNIGGGSTELAAFDNGNIVGVLSIPCGSLQLTMKYIRGTLPLKSHILSIKKEVLRTLKHVKVIDKQPLDLCAAGGTALAACRLYNDIYDLDQNTVMEAEKLADILLKYNAERRDINKRIKLLFPEKFHTLIPGMTVLNTIAGITQSTLIYVSPSGVSEGYYLKRILSQPGNA